MLIETHLSESVLGSCGELMLDFCGRCAVAISRAALGKAAGRKFSDAAGPVSGAPDWLDDAVQEA